jgi:hypothetical protein
MIIVRDARSSIGFARATRAASGRLRTSFERSSAIASEMIVRDLPAALHAQDVTTPIHVANASTSAARRSASITIGPARSSQFN